MKKKVKVKKVTVKRVKVKQVKVKRVKMKKDEIEQVKVKRWGWKRWKWKKIKVKDENERQTVKSEIICLLCWPSALLSVCFWLIIIFSETFIISFTRRAEWLLLLTGIKSTKEMVHLQFWLIYLQPAFIKCHWILWKKII